ncbi:MAG: hypothetical protein BRC36_04755, partial [Cyanobacteria bacterium QH_2_48_84]
DQQGLPPLLRRLQFRRGWFHRLRLIWGDRAYGGTHAVRVGPGAVPLHAGSAGAAPRPCFPISPPALVVERTLDWISRCRRLSQDNEKLPRTWETFIYLAMIELMLKRLAETLATSKTSSQRLFSQPAR